MKAVVTFDDMDAAADLIPPAARTVRFAWEGVGYEVDLNDEHYAQLWNALKPFIDVARRERKAAEPAKAQAITAGADVPRESGVNLYHAVNVSKRTYLIGLRKWAEDSGDPVEMRDYPGGSRGYNYLAKHFQGYEQWLSEQDRMRMAG
jgi:hypothetical protein